MNRIRYKHFINSVMKEAYGHRWTKIKKKLKKITIIKISDQAEIGEEDMSYLQYAMTKTGTIVELSNSEGISFSAPNVIRSLYGN